MYDGAKCHVLHGGKVSEDFEVESGVPYSCVLSRILFLIVIGDVLMLPYPANVGSSNTATTLMTFISLVFFLLLLYEGRTWCTLIPVCNILLGTLVQYYGLCHAVKSTLPWAMGAEQ